MMENLLADKLDENLIKQYNIAKKKYKKKTLPYNFRISSKVWFNDSLWDLNFLNKKNRAQYIYRFNFEKVPEPYVFYIKTIIINELVIIKNSIGAIDNLFGKLSTITKAMMSLGICDTRLIDKKAISEFMDEKIVKCKLHYIEGLGCAMKKLIQIIEEVEGYKFDDIVKYLNEINKHCYRNRPISAVNNYIPDKFLNELVSFALQDIDNCCLKKDERIMACLIVIIAETGMRNEEASLLETGKLDTIKVINRELCYLRFTTFKTKRYKNNGRETYTWMSDKAVKAYRMCEMLVDEIINNLSEITKLKLTLYLCNKKHLKVRYSKGNLRSMVSQISKEKLDVIKKESKKYLFISAITGIQKKGSALFRENLEKFFLRHSDDFNLEDIPMHQRQNIKTFQISSKSKYDKYFSKAMKEKLSFDQVNKRSYLYINPHMFRVTVCTKLFMQGVHIDFIVKHMNHLAEDMTNYYNKSYDFIDELKESMCILASITNDHGLIITDAENINDEYLKTELNNKYFKSNIDKINEFLSANKLNIKDDLIASCQVV